ASVFFHVPATATTQISPLSLHDALPILRDAALFEVELVKNPNDPRSQFYLGQLYRDARHFPEALAAYKQRALMDIGWAEERFMRSEEHTSELQSQSNLVCRLLLEKKKKQ